MSSLPTGTVTFLFTDIEGSTALLQRLGDRRYAELLAEHQRVLRDAFTTGNGHEVDTQGDAFLVAFPRARDAVATAVAAQQALIQHPWPDGASFQVRMGLHTGEPVTGGTGYVGLGVHRAARICAAGHGGQIVVSQTTADLIESDLPSGVALLDLGDHRLKDLRRPERLFQVLHTDLPASFPALKSLGPVPDGAATPRPVYRSPVAERLRRVPLVGRVETLRRLVERLELIRTGPTGMILISGEPGIGKSRLLDELVDAARARGIEVLAGGCRERNLAIPYLPIGEALEGLARTAGHGKWERLVQAAGPDIHAVLSDHFSKHMVRGSVMRVEHGILDVGFARPSRAVRAFLQELSQEAPGILVVIDDLHWADPPTLDLLHDLALSLREMPVLIVGAYREVELERTHPLSRLLVELNRERLLHRERLRCLTPEQTCEFLSELLGGPAPHGLAGMIHHQTEGNPFFVEELTSGLVEEGRLVRNGDGSPYQLAPGVAVEQLAGEVPQGIRAAIGARLDAQDQQVLTLASVIGREFPLEVLIRLCGAHGIDEEAVEGALERTQAARFVSAAVTIEGSRDVHGFTSGGAEPDADWAFDHALIHQVVYGELDRRRRRRLHAEVGHLLEELYHGREGLYAERLAYHYLEGDDDAKALQYCRSAGDKMLRAYYDPDLALDYYLPPLEAIVARDPALRHMRAAFPVALRHGSTHRFTPEEREAVIVYLEGVLRTVGGTPAARAVAQLANRICIAAMHVGEVYEQSIRLYEQTLLGPNLEKVVVPTSRGKLVGILEFPADGGPYPVVMMFHGGVGTKETLADEAARYLARGLAALRVDLPGSGESTVPRTSSPADAEILKDLITAVLAHPRADSRGVGLYGVSYGPWHAAQLCARGAPVRAMVSISGVFNPLEREDVDPKAAKTAEAPPAVLRAWREARWKAGGQLSPDPVTWSPDSSVYDIADRIHCPMLLVYGALEPERYRRQSEKLASLVPTARTRAWRSGVHVLLNVPEAHEAAADWMKRQLARSCQ